MNAVDEPGTAAGRPRGRFEPLPVPPRALDVDLTQSFTQLLFRASRLRKLRDEDAREAANTQRDLLAMLIEVDDTLAALGSHPELARIGGALGIDATRRRLLGKLANVGVRPMRLEGMAADPLLTEIAGTEARSDEPPDTVVRTVVTGFFWNDEVLRRAQVVVAKKVGGSGGSGGGTRAGTGTRAATGKRKKSQ